VAQYFDSLMGTIYQSDKYQDLIHLCPLLVVRLNHQLLYVDDSDAILSSVASDTIEYLNRIIDRRVLKTDLVKELFTTLMEALKDPDIYAFDYGHEIWDLLTKLIITDDDYAIFNKVMSSHVKHLKDDWSRDYTIQKMLVCQAQSLARLGHRDRLEEFIAQHLHNHQIRKMAIEMAMQEEKYEHALTLVEGGIKIASENNQSRNIVDWEKMKMQILQKRGDEDALLQQAKHNLLYHDFSMPTFHLIKSSTNPNAWLPTRDSLISELKEKGKSLSESYLMQIYRSEEMWQSLLDSVSAFGSDFYILDEYVKELMQFDRGAVIDLYLNRIENFVYLHLGRKYYKVVARYLKKVKAWGEPEKASALAEKIRHAYPYRSALLEELKGI
jgi:hypothetical protein